jgi:hypothetical protein
MISFGFTRIHSAYTECCINVGRLSNNLQKEKKLLIIPQGDHPLMKKEYEKRTKAIPEWIKKYVIYA